MGISEDTKKILLEEIIYCFLTCMGSAGLMLLHTTVMYMKPLSFPKLYQFVEGQYICTIRMKQQPIWMHKRCMNDNNTVAKVHKF